MFSAIAWPRGVSTMLMFAGDRPDAALADQVKSLDWVARKARHKGKVSADELAQVRAKMVALIGK